MRHRWKQIYFTNQILAHCSQKESRQSCWRQSCLYCFYLAWIPFVIKIFNKQRRQKYSKGLYFIIIRLTVLKWNMNIWFNVFLMDIFSQHLYFLLNRFGELYKKKTMKKGNVFFCITIFDTSSSHMYI